jgi:2-oxo-4-hydroxy-4-carboxy--5-ureidoimidazoline (OHCU) decarboxylase
LTIQAAKGILRSSSGKVDPEEERTKEIMRKNYPDIEGRFAQKLENVDSVRANQANTEDTRVTLKEFKDNLKKGEEVKLEAFPFMHLVDKKKAKTLHKRTKFADLQADLKKDYRDLYCK